MSLPPEEIIRQTSVETLLDVFLTVARNPSTIEEPVLECGTEQWTYGDLDSISSGIALELYNEYGLHPTVASISENHPYVLAVLLATWKLGGVFAPFDPHSPPAMVEKMVENVEPTCTLVPDDEERLIGLLQELRRPTILFSKGATIISMTQRYIDQSADIFPLDAPSLSSLALYLHTSSASSAANLKCVQLSHESIARGSLSLVNWFSRAWPSVTFEKLKVLGFVPWSHIMAIFHDIGGAVFMTGGCYVFGVAPPGYPLETPTHVGKISGKDEKEMDILDRLLETAVRTFPDVFICVPWVLEGFKERYTWLVESNMMKEALEVKFILQDIKCFSVGGAAMSPEAAGWARDMNINLCNNIGMTEFGTALFQTKVDHLNGENDGWSMEDCFIEDAKLILLDEDSIEDFREGELVVTSRYISHGYLKYENASFSETSDGWITFKTGDLYARKANGRFVWKGRKDDYIQMASSETLDPRPVEKALNSSPMIAHCCVVGNNFLNKPSDVICVLIQPVNAALSPTQMAQITKAVAAVNRTLLPPLRIAWSRVGILDDGMKIPYTRKGTIFRKKLEMLFGDFLERLLLKSTVNMGSSTSHSTAINGKGRDLSEPEEHYYTPNESPQLDQTVTLPQGNEWILDDKKKSYGQNETKIGVQRVWKKKEVERLVMETIAGVLGIASNVLDANLDISFAELGMDSNMAVRIVNQLNSIFSLFLPLNASHTLINLTEMTNTVLVQLGLKEEHHNLLLQPEPTTYTAKEDVVIIGQALRLPGNINTPESFWKALMDKRDDIMTPPPADRWDHPSFYRPPSSISPPQNGDISFEKAGFVDVAHFDNAFFGISSPEAYFVSPTVRLTLETAFEALENACIPISKVKGSKMGVFVGAGMDEGYGQLLFQAQGWDAYTRFFGTGNAVSTASGRLSYLLDVHGPSITADTACSSGLVVLDQAVHYIQSGDGESALVTAVNTNLWPGSFGFLSAQKMSSPHSRCATFTNEADGYVPSEGSVAFILKSKSAALRDGDNILAVIRSTGVMHGGKSQGLVAPNVNTQIALQHALLQKAGLHPSQIDFLETHGTGTSLGDLIETQGINEVFRDSHPENPLILGAAKSCIGHTEMAAGLVGLLKTIASFKHATVPGLVHLDEHNINPSINCSIVPLHIPYEAVSLPNKGENIPYRGLVLSNGFAGTIAGVVLEDPINLLTEALPGTSNIATDELRPMPFVVSAKTVEGLQQYLQIYLDFCRTTPALQFIDICYTSCIGREHYRYRFSCIAFNMEELIASLEHELQIFRAEKYNRLAARRVAFAFPGQGSQYQGMASALADYYPDFKDIVTLASERASKLSGHPITSFLLEKKASGRVITIDDSRVAQICIFVYQYSMAVFLKKLCIKPYAVLGHSLGEISAAVVAGAMSFELGLDLVITRAELLRGDPQQPGGMAIIAASTEVISQLLHQQDLETRLVIAVYNGPESHVVSGELTAIESFLESAKAQGFRAAKLNVGQGYHSPSIYHSLPALQMWLDENQPLFSHLSISFYSTAYGSEIPVDSQLGPSYWVEHARDPVKFSNAAQELMSNKDIDIILDIGPQPFILTALQALPQQKNMIAITAKPSIDQNTAFLRGISLLFEHGITPDFGELFANSLVAKKTAVPTYPFQRQHHYPDYLPSRHSRSPGPSPKALQTPRSPSVDKLVQFPVNQELYDLLSDHQIEGRRVAPGASLVDFFANHVSSRSLTSITFHSPLVIESPDLEVTGQIDAEGNFFLRDGYSTHQVCSGITAAKPTLCKHGVDGGRSPMKVQSNAEVYESFKHVYFGPSFRNIEELRTWTTHADALITVQSTLFQPHDRIRKIDCCLHAFGSIVQREVPQLRGLDGAFLPASLNDFTLHCDDLPESIICRYYLPLDVARNYHLMSVAFDVFSLSGELLISCGKYSVAWIPSGVVIQNKDQAKALENGRSHWLRQAWKQQDLTQEKLTSSGFKKYNQILLITPHSEDSRPYQLFAALAEQIYYLNFFVAHDSAADDLTESLDFQFNKTMQKIAGTETLIVLDLTSLDALPTTGTFNYCHQRVLHLMQLLLRHKINISNLLVISEMSVAVHSIPHLTPPLQNDAILPSVSSVIQGMVRVFRRETGFDGQVWALDLPSLNSMSNEAFRDIIVRELNARREGLTFDRTTAYRPGEDDALHRLVPVLGPIDDISEAYNTGTSVIVGLGSIGSALARYMISKGFSRIIFIGRRHPEDSEILKSLLNIQSGTTGRVSYVQADVSCSESLRSSIVDIQARYGAIENIIHTAAVISDATIQNVESESFERVLEPKVMGAWNLHFISEELCPSLKSFVLLSSISVSLGNQGQVAYVAGNSYMEVLASYRHQKNLPATALQLGPWESRLTKNINVANSLVRTMKNERGIPLILKAMLNPEPVQIIADLDLDMLAMSPAYSQDPLFQDILPSTRKPSTRPMLTSDEVLDIVTRALRAVLELKPSEKLEPTEPLTACGVDSISFAQIRGRVMNELQVDVPMMFLSDSFTIHEMIAYVVLKYSSS